MKLHTLVTCVCCDDDTEVYLRKDVRLNSGEVPNYLEWPDTGLTVFTGPATKRFHRGGSALYLQVIILQSSWDYSTKEALLKSVKELDGWEEDPDQLEDVGRQNERMAKQALSFRSLTPYHNMLGMAGAMPMGLAGYGMGADQDEPSPLVPSKLKKGDKGVMVPKSTLFSEGKKVMKKAKAKKAKKSKKK